MSAGNRDTLVTPTSRRPALSLRHAQRDNRRQQMPDIHQQLVIGAPREQVFSALTTQEGLAGWWTPKVTAKPERNSIARFGFGPDYVKQMRIVELDPPTRLAWRCIAGADEWVGTALTFELTGGTPEALLQSHPEAAGQLQQLENAGEATLLSFAHDDWKAYTPMFAECSYTWGRFLRGLKLLCETGTGLPTPHEHSVMGRE
jgi:uncharacterized protein YndB with AHSA1/START domain